MCLFFFHKWHHNIFLTSYLYIENFLDDDSQLDKVSVSLLIKGLWDANHSNGTRGRGITKCLLTWLPICLGDPTETGLRGRIWCSSISQNAWKTRAFKQVCLADPFFHSLYPVCSTCGHVLTEDVGRVERVQSRAWYQAERVPSRAGRSVARSSLIFSKTDWQVFTKLTHKNIKIYISWLWNFQNFGRSSSCWNRLSNLRL